MFKIGDKVYVGKSSENSYSGMAEVASVEDLFEHISKSPYITDQNPLKNISKEELVKRLNKIKHTPIKYSLSSDLNHIWSASTESLVPQEIHESPLYQEMKEE